MQSIKKAYTIAGESLNLLKNDYIDQILISNLKYVLNSNIILMGSSVINFSYYV